MNYSVRIATLRDIPAMHRVRKAARENPFSDRMGIGEDAYVPFVSTASAWVAESDKALVGFAAADLATSSVWALFVEPGFEDKGVGRALHERLLVWAREQDIEKLYLSTAADSRAATFYAQSGWIEAGVTENGEIRFELPVRR